MIYKVGDTRVVRYDAWKRITGQAANIMAVARRPDGTQVLLSPTELDSGTNPITQGIYEVTVTLDQDGEWLILFDTLLPGMRRPHNKSFTVDTVVKDALLKIASAQEIDDQLSSTHGPGIWESENLAINPVTGRPHE